MKLVIVPPYESLNPVMQGHRVFYELIDRMKKRGQLEGVEIDIGEGYLVETTDVRDFEYYTSISMGTTKRVKEYSAMGKYDAIVVAGAQDPGFIAEREVANIPVTGMIHSAVHLASLIGERFSIIHTVVTSSLIIKHAVESYGFGNKLASVRYIGHSSTEMGGLFDKYRKKEEWAKVPELKKIINDITTQCIAAIEKDRADSIILACEPIEVLEDDVRRELDKAGYSEIPLISMLLADVEMAKALVNMKLIQAPRAYPRPTIKAKPEYW